MTKLLSQLSKYFTIVNPPISPPTTVEDLNEIFNQQELSCKRLDPLEVHSLAQERTWPAEFLAFFRFCDGLYLKPQLYKKGCSSLSILNRKEMTSLLRFISPCRDSDLNGSEGAFDLPCLTHKLAEVMIIEDSGYDSNIYVCLDATNTHWKHIFYQDSYFDQNMRINLRDNSLFDFLYELLLEFKKIEKKKY